MSRLLALFAAGLAAGQSPAAVFQTPAPVFQSGTRLVEVEVVVRAHRVRPPGLGQFFKWVFDDGPPWGPPGEPLGELTKDDFALLDNGKPQSIAVFSEGPRGEAKPMPLPPGAVSNRTGDNGQTLNGATVVLVDFLNTDWVMSEYLRLGFRNLLRDLKLGGKIPVYTLGKKLHVLQNVTGDDLKSALQDYGNPPTAYVDPRENREITLHALKAITQHLDGIPGRKNLVWAGGHPSNAVIDSLQQAGIIVYPVKVRSAGIIDPEMPSGGRMFLDALDLTAAVRTAEEDSGVAYSLGYYPAEDALDGKYHKITVRLKDSEIKKEAAEVHYRAGYLATKFAVLPPAPSLADVLNDSLDATAIGLAARATPEAGRAGMYDLRVIVDLRDIHLEPTDGRFAGGLEFAIPNPSVTGTLKAGSIRLSLSDEQLAKGLDRGFTFTITGVESESDKIRIVVRDRTTGVAGSLRVPVAK
jgi:hypothetical protein